MKKVIHTDDAPKAIGTYSQAVLADKFLFISGQIGLDPATMELVEGFEEETIQVFRNISAICKEADCSINDVIKFNVLLTDLSNFQKVNEIMEKVLEKPYPARAAYEVSALPKNSSIEIESIAYKE
ncbi:MAG: RidA family protein [Pseudomonadota bacterium]|nr:RidA family protein [Pseudomonadota bacterium]